MAKIAFIGAGSVVFSENLLGDVLSFPELGESHIALMDIDEARLSTAERMAKKVGQALGANPKVTAHLNRREALEGADYIINSIQVGGFEPATMLDFEIPKKYGLRQSIGDTLGIGGIMRGLRTIPVLLDICRDIEELCPNAQLLNYSNPMAMLCWAVNRATKVKMVGLCHSVQGTAWQLASDLQLPLLEIDYLCAGINHMAFYLKFEHKGEDLYPRLMKRVEEDTQPDFNRVRYEMMKRLGYFVTESSEHFAEYVPHFIRRDRPDLLNKFEWIIDEYPRRCRVQIERWQEMKERYESDDPISVKRSNEYGSLIIHSMETGQPRVIYGNVQNNSLISNLPSDCVVEVPCLVDKCGVQPTQIGALPPQLAAIIQTNINVQSLTVEAALKGKREHIYQAAMLDPHTAAELTLDEIWSMVDDLLEAHKPYLPKYS
ncbi:MAG: alpha-glucosidase/alpha-galactosidase [bacterium]|jgi:alpha-galactosidase